MKKPLLKLYNNMVSSKANIYQKYFVKMIPAITFVIILLSIPVIVFCQKDSAHKQTIDIISSYKPVLKNITKINLTASPLKTDTSIPKLNYNIPPINLFYTYQPITIRPLALTVDSSILLGVRNYVKAGFGNYSTPFLQTALGFGDGKNELLNIAASYISSKGKMINQDVTNLILNTEGSYFTPKNEVYGAGKFNFNQYYQYGYNHALYSFSKDSIDRANNDILISGGIRNIRENKNQIYYDATIDADLFSRGRNVNESDLFISITIEKIINDKATVRVKVSNDLSSYKNKMNSNQFQINNNLFMVLPSIDYNLNNYTIHAGIKSISDNGAALILPDFRAAIKLPQQIIFEAGLEGSILKNTVKSLSLLNPFMDYPTFLKNTKESKLFAGIRTKIRHHMDVTASLGFIRFTNTPLFVNDTLSGKGFYIKNEFKMNSFNIHGEVRYYSQEKFSITSILDINTYAGLKDNANAWEMIPVKFIAEANWKVNNTLLLKSSLNIFSGIPVKLKNNSERILPTITDLNVGSEFTLSKQFRLWFDINNLLNKKYERWNNYPVYGMQIIGGIIYQF